MTEFRLPTARAEYLGLVLAADGPGVTAWWGTQTTPRSAAHWPCPGDPPDWQLTHRSLSLSADGEWVSTYERRPGEVRITRVGETAPTAVLPFRHPGDFLWSAVAPGGREVAWASDPDLWIYRVPDGKLVKKLRAGFTYLLEYSRSGRWLSGVGTRVVRVYDRDAGFRAVRWKAGGYARVAAADGPTAVSVGNTPDAYTVWDLTGPTPVAELPAGGSAGVAAISADGQRVLTSDAGGGVSLWDAGGTRLKQYAWGVRAIALTFAPDRLTAAAGGNDGRIVVWDLDD